MDKETLTETSLPARTVGASRADTAAHEQHRTSRPPNPSALPAEAIGRLLAAYLAALDRTAMSICERLGIPDYAAAAVMATIERLVVAPTFWSARYPRAYAMTTLTNVCVDEYRRRKKLRKALLSMGEAAVQPGDAPNEREAMYWTAVMLGLTHIPRFAGPGYETREPLRFLCAHQLGGQSYEALARHEGIEPASMRRKACPRSTWPSS